MNEEETASFEDPAGKQAEEVGKEGGLEDVNEQGLEEDGEETEEEEFSEEELDEDDKDEEEGLEGETIPIDWTPPDCHQNPNYKLGLIKISESIAGRLGGKLPVLVAQSRLDNRPSPQNWLPSSLQKRCAPASAFLQGLVTKCDKIFRETNKTSLDKKKGLLSR